MDLAALLQARRNVNRSPVRLRAPTSALPDPDGFSSEVLRKTQPLFGEGETTSWGNPSNGGAGECSPLGIPASSDSVSTNSFGAYAICELSYLLSSITLSVYLRHFQCKQHIFSPDMFEVAGTVSRKKWMVSIFGERLAP